MALPSTHPYRQEALQHLTMLQVRLKADQFDLTVISQLTELSIEQLQTLQQPSQR
jgi:hypothetical protein